LTDAAPVGGGSPRVVDVCGSALGAEGWLASLLGFRADAPDFLSSFVPGLARAAGLDPRRVATLLAGDPDAALRELADGLGVDAAAEAEQLRADGFRLQVIHGGWQQLEGGGNLNDHVLGRAQAHPDVFQAWCGLDPREPAAALAELERCLGLGAAGVTVLPFLTGTDPESDACRRIYDAAAAAAVPLWLHCGFNAARGVPMTTPSQLDRIANRHRGLKLIAGHGAWPWVGELVAVMMRQPNLYLDTSAHNPATMPAPGSGWEPLLLNAGGLLRGRVLFGSAAAVHGVTAGRFADGVRRLGLPESVEAGWLHDNAAALLGLDANANEGEVGHGAARA
jgi:predicted TIM-barrel fold metal-dependent hydrolase